jgi:hypothetical protein
MSGVQERTSTRSFSIGYGWLFGVVAGAPDLVAYSTYPYRGTHMRVTTARSGSGLEQPTNGPTGATIRHDVVEQGRRLSTETNSAFKTTEYVAPAAVVR